MEISFQGVKRSAISRENRQLIVNQAVILLEQMYVHLPLKRAMHAVDPVRKLKLLSQRLYDEQSDVSSNELLFHREMVTIFNSLRDLHTAYLLPSPFREFTAYLPFKIELVKSGEEGRFIVAHLAAGWDAPKPFARGVEIITWNGVPISRVLGILGDQLAGSNIDARRARALVGLTTRPLIRHPPPDESFILVQFQTPGSKDVRELRFHWNFIRTPETIRWDNDVKKEVAETALAMDIGAAAAARSDQQLYAPQVAAIRSKLTLSGTANLSDLETELPEQLEVKGVTAKNGKNFGYIRIRSFYLDDDKLINELTRVLAKLPSTGLIIDVRDNGGGNLLAAERLLQLFTPKRIEPEKAQFICSASNLNLCRCHSPSPYLTTLDFSPWVESLQRAVETGASHSASVELTSTELCNNVGQKYFGPVAVIINALCYSATDIFVAGFQDHEIGPVIGVSGHTGAGGANVWTYDVLANLLNPAVWGGAGTAQLQALPEGVNITLALRRMLRIGKHAGTELEDLGVVPDLQYTMTERDILSGNVDLIEYAAHELSKRPNYTFHIQVDDQNNLWISVTGIDRIDTWIDGRPLGSTTAHGDTKISLPAAIRPDAAVETHGFASGNMVARRRDQLSALPKIIDH